MTSEVSRLMFGTSEIIALTNSSVPLSTVTVAVILVVNIAYEAADMLMSLMFWSSAIVTLMLAKLCNAFYVVDR